MADRFSFAAESCDRAHPRRIVVHPNNPSGSHVHKNEKELLNSFCREHELAVIADEVFLDYAHNGVPPATFAASRDVLTFTLSGVSKISALPQMKVAWIATSAPRQRLNRRMIVSKLSPIPISP